MIYFFSAMFAVLASLLGIFITGFGLKPASHIRIGLRAILVSYFLGLVLLAAAIVSLSR